MKRNFLTIEFLRKKRTKSYFLKKHKINHKKVKSKKRRYIYVGNKKTHINAFKCIAPTKQKKIRKKSILNLDIPKEFSLYDDPESALSLISEVAHIDTIKKISGVYVDHSECVKNELGAELLLATAVKSIDTLRQDNGQKISIKGIFASETKVARLINSIGIVKEFCEDTPETDTQEIAEKLKLFRRMRINLDKVDKQSSDIKSRTVQDFVEFIESKCLTEIGRSFSINGRESVIDYVGEILDNAQEHSGTPYWHIYGYLDATDPDNMQVEIIIYNLGISFYETFRNKKQKPEVYSEIEKYISKHHNSGIGENCLITVAALQQLNSSKLDVNPTRGMGTMDLLKFFGQVSNECCGDSNDTAKMYLITGDAYLKFDGKYSIAKDEDEFGIYSFNKENSLEIPPDKKYVRSLKGVNFPGSIIGIQFPIGRSSTLIEESKYDGNN